MSTFSVTLERDRATKLEKIAKSLGLTVEDIIQLSIEDLISRSDHSFTDAMNYILEKNKELYKRLA
jgi:antitoxin FitA